MLLTLGTKGEAGEWNEAAGSRKLNQPNDVAIARNGDSSSSRDTRQDRQATHESSSSTRPERSSSRGAAKARAGQPAAHCLPLRLAHLNTFDQPGIPLPAAAAGMAPSTRAQQAARIRCDVLPWPRSSRCSKSASAGVEHPGRQESAGLGAHGRIGSSWTAERPAHCRRPALAGHQRVRRPFAPQATNPQWQYPTLWNPKVNYTWLMGRAVAQDRLRVPGHRRREVQDVNPLYGRDSYTGQFITSGRRGGRATSITLARLHARPALAVRAQQRCFVADMRQRMHFAYVPGRRARERSADAATLGLRYEYATPDVGGEQPASRTSIRRRARWSASGRIDRRSRARQSRSQERLRPRLGFACTAAAAARSCAAAGASATCTATGCGRRTCSPINAPAGHSTRSSTRRTRRGRAFRANAAGLSRRASPIRRTFNPLTSIVSYIAEGPSTPSPCRTGASRSSASSAPSMLVGRRLRRQPARATCCCSRNYNQAAPNNSAGTIALAGAPPASRPFGDITYVFNGGKSRYNALQVKCGVAHEERTCTLLSALTLVEGEGQLVASRSRTRTATSRIGAGLSTTSRPTTGRPATTSRTTARPAWSGRCRLAAEKCGATGRSRASTRSRRARW